MPKTSKYHKKIIEYYDSSQWLYNLFVYNKKSLGMHFGFWKPGTKNRQEAIIYENQEIIDLGEIKKGMKVLDAGCGVGGTAIYIAKKTGARVWGTTLSENQVNLAKIFAKKKGVSNKTLFSKQDYQETNFPENYFDVVYGVESICYAYPKQKFLSEAYRILKPGGILLILDGYTTRKPKNKIEKAKLKDFNKAFSIREISTENQFYSLIKGSGFVNVKRIDKTKEVVRAAKYFYIQGIRFYLLIKLLSLVPSRYFKSFEKNRIATRLFYEFITSGFGCYYIHYAEKPKN